MKVQLKIHGEKRGALLYLHAVAVANVNLNG